MEAALSAGTQPAEIAAKKLTRINYAFANLASSFTAELGDSYADYDMFPSKHLALARPFGRQVGETDNSQAVWEPSINGRLD